MKGRKPRVRFCPARAAALAAVLSLCASPAQAQEGMTLVDQQNLIVYSVEQWKPKKAGSYAVTDLDQDGSLELITTYTKNEVSENHLWEIDQENRKLTELALPWEEEEPSLLLTQTKAAFGADQGTCAYLFGEEGAEFWLTLEEEGLTLLEAAPEGDGIEEKSVKIKWISTQEHPLSQAPFEQIMELVGESCAGFILQ